jgi:hypothetical protein
MEYPIINSRPHFELSEADEANLPRVRRIKQLEEAIFRSPDLYSDVLSRLGLNEMIPPEDGGENYDATAPADSVENSDDPENQLRALFADRGYRGEFDDETEEALATNADHQEVVAAHLKSRNVRFSSHQQELLRAEVRRSRMAYFIGRVSVWDEQQASVSNLPSAG